MWQRIQTLYTGIAAILIAALALSNVFEGTRYISKLPFAILIFISLLCELVSLFSFKKRSLQIRLLAVSLVLCLALQVWLGIDYFSLPEAVFSWTAVFPLLVVILNVMAMRGIYADELIVRSSARIRSARSKAEIKASREARKNKKKTA